MAQELHIDEAIFSVFERLDRAKKNSVKPLRKIAIFSTPRSGSTYFCDVLLNSQAIGEPWEFFNRRFMATYSKYFKKTDIKFTDYLDFIYTKTTSESGTFSAKILMDQYMYFLKEKKFDLLSLGFDSIILLKRRDKIAQAYSYCKAHRSDQWNSTVKATVKVHPDTIKNANILNAMGRISSWEEYFDSHLSDKVNLNYVYEDLIKQKNFHIEVLKDLKIDTSSINKSKSDLQPQTNENDLSRIKEFKKWIKSL
jgi:LPS sulfotransferase NodH